MSFRGSPAVPVPLRARVVEVIADLGEDRAPRFRYGSGCIVFGRTVLTAAHVVVGAVAVRVRGPDKLLHQVAVDPRFIGDTDGSGPDLALVEIADPTIDLAPMPLARVDRDSPEGDAVKDCHAIGYPWFATQPSPTAVRNTVDAYGYLPVLSKLVNGLLSVQVSSSPRPLPKTETLERSPWAGISGGPVVAAGCLLGVVTEHAPREGPSSITATPLSALHADPEHPGWGCGVPDPAAWWVRLGVSGMPALGLLPIRRPLVQTKPAVLLCRPIEEVSDPFGFEGHRAIDARSGVP